MPVAPKAIPIYHITHIDNLLGILQTGCLYCQLLLNQAGFKPVSIAFPSIQNRRAITTVPHSPGSVIHSYVPFYFAPRSPMLYDIHKNNLEYYDGGQIPIVYLVSSVTQMQNTNHSFIFTDGRATVAFTRFFTDLTDLNHIDWPLMKKAYWHDTMSDPDRKRRRQAEFLVHNQVTLSAFIGIGVMNEHIKQQVEDLLSTYQIGLPVHTWPEWYY